ncbi:hypothetical protein NPIL_214951 [Nephila pilipes]|uniref:Uncharacterized protein n=1 Tax=Nephila pilipes TaxID=299642 RepID=A0A8X6N8W2_NEPPI|nr:hypothetical protein NPIL_214951 [Nephila pilipes]
MRSSRSYSITKCIKPIEIQWQSTEVHGGSCKEVSEFIWKYLHFGSSNFLMLHSLDFDGQSSNIGRCVQNVSSECSQKTIKDNEEILLANIFPFMKKKKCGQLFGFDFHGG